MKKRKAAKKGLGQTPTSAIFLICTRQSESFPPSFSHSILISVRACVRPFVKEHFFCTYVNIECNQWMISAHILMKVRVCQYVGYGIEINSCSRMLEARVREREEIKN
jgi:hypothetical protein